MKIYVVSLRYGSDLIEPSVFKTREEADDFASDFIFSHAWDLYDGDPDATEEDLYEWAEDNGYVLSENYFLDGGSDAYEALVTDAEINIK